MENTNKNIITINDIYPEHEKISLNLNRFSELLIEIDKVQTYLNKFGFELNVKVT